MINKINDTSVYTVKDIMQHLKVGKNSAYALVKSGVFPVIKVGDTFRVSKEVFNRWINGEAV